MVGQNIGNDFPGVENCQRWRCTIPRCDSVQRYLGSHVEDCRRKRLQRWCKES
jgi:hypothetical protein